MIFYLQYPVDTEVPEVPAFIAVGAQTFESFPHVLHHLNGFGANTAMGFGIVWFEINNFEIVSLLHRLFDHPYLVRVRKFLF